MQVRKENYIPHNANYVVKGVVILKKHEYEIVINSFPQKAKTYIYDYASNKGKGIELTISKNKIRILAKLSALYEIKNIVISTNHIFADVIKKSLLLHFILYSKNIDITQMIIRLDDKYDHFEIPQKPYNPPVYSLITKDLSSNISKDWNNDNFINALLSRTVSNFREDNRWAALYAAICAKSKVYEVERFMYFWMAFNGVYGYFAKLINSERHKIYAKECVQIKWLLKLYHYGNEHISENDSPNIARKAISILSKYDLDMISGIDSIPKEMKSALTEILQFDDGKKYDILPEGYLLTGLPYYFRCKYFHGGRILPLFSFADEKELKCLHLINIVLEEFIDKNLHNLFDDGYVNENFGDRIIKIANNKL